MRKFDRQHCFKFIVLIFFIFFSTLNIQSQDLKLDYCDDDGYLTFDIDWINEYVKENLNVNNTFSEKVLISTSKGNIIAINDPSTNPTKETICNLNGKHGSFLDIAVNSDQEIFVNNSAIYSVDDNCSVTNYPYSIITNALSFDDLDNLYIGSHYTSTVYRATVGNQQLNNLTAWHNFNTGSSGGDFVLLGDKMYISWRLASDNFRLYEVTVDTNRNYISHVDLGKLPSDTYGLASELGKLYGITPYKLFEIDPVNVTTTDIITNSNSTDLWYGAAGFHEAISYTSSVHLTLTDAQNGVNELVGEWQNSVIGGQILYIRIEDSSDGSYETYTLELNINISPFVNSITNLESCYSSELSIFDLNLVIQEIDPLGISNYSFEFYDENPSNNIFAIPLSTLYQSVAIEETLYVKIEDISSGCSSVYDFKIINNEIPILLPLSSIDNSPTLLELCHLDEQNNLYFNLDDIQEKIILSNEEDIEVSYYLTEDDATNEVNSLASKYYLNTQQEEIFLRVVTKDGCYSISNFYLQSNCIEGIETLVNVVFPDFFTPNGDGINDFWNISEAPEIIMRESMIYIYDRFGKELYSFTPISSKGWDGTYYGNNVISNDYWYQIITESGLKKVGHFSLLR